MQLNRRNLLAGLSATPFLAGCQPDANTLQGRFASAFKHARKERFGLAVFDANGQIRFQLDLPERGHGIAAHPGQAGLISVSRRPGTHLISVDKITGNILNTQEAETDRHYYGHGVYTADGAVFYTTENAFESGEGIIGVYDSQSLTRLGEFPAYGIGPHELLLMPDGRTLAVAIGGIQTHPSAPRQKLNIPTMQPALNFIDAKTGALKRRWSIPTPDLNQLSIRHIAVNQQNQIAAAFQWEGGVDVLPPLVGLCTQSSGWQFMRAPERVQKAMRLYCGSVAFSADGRRFIASSPRGDILTVWNVRTGFEQSYALGDGCGVAMAPDDDGAFVASSGLGKIAQIKTDLTMTETDIVWDNHLTAI